MEMRRENSPRKKPAVGTEPHVGVRVRIGEKVGSEKEFTGILEITLKKTHEQSQPKSEHSTG